MCSVPSSLKKLSRQHKDISTSAAPRGASDCWVSCTAFDQEPSMEQIILQSEGLSSESLRRKSIFLRLFSSSCYHDRLSDVTTNMVALHACYRKTQYAR